MTMGDITSPNMNGGTQKVSSHLFPRERLKITILLPLVSHVATLVVAHDPCIHRPFHSLCLSPALYTIASLWP